MEPREKEKIRINNNQESEGMLYVDDIFHPHEVLSAADIIITLEKSNKYVLDKYLKELSISKKEVLYCALSRIDKNLDE